MLREKENTVSMDLSAEYIDFFVDPG